MSGKKGKQMICPIFKKGEKGKVRNYRGITLMNATYKIYASVLNERYVKEIRGKLEEGQFGFRKGMGG